ncbi:MAG: hypothetical protein II336_07790 [Loktanella sp.]|nr:hypothetical protein [Loktanella sp.]
MTRLIAALTVLTFAAAAPAAAMSFSFSLPVLTYPAPPAPDVTQSCTGSATPVVETCTAPTK